MKGKNNSPKLKEIQTAKENLNHVKSNIISKKEFLETHTPDHSDLEKRIQPVYCDISRLRKERSNF